MRVINLLWRLWLLFALLVAVAVFCGIDLKNFSHDVRIDLTSGSGGWLRFEFNYLMELGTAFFAGLIFLAWSRSRFSYYALSLIFAAWLLSENNLFIMVEYLGIKDPFGVFPMRDHVAVATLHALVAMGVYAFGPLMVAAHTESPRASTATFVSVVVLMLVLYVFETEHAWEMLWKYQALVLEGASRWHQNARMVIVSSIGRVVVATASILSALLLLCRIGLTRRST